MFAFFGFGWCRSNSKVGASADECEGDVYCSCKEPLAGKRKKENKRIHTKLIAFIMLF